jgi:hypothetical protein
MPELWVPGAAEPSIDAFVERVLGQIERFAKACPGGEAQVEIELRDGSLLPLESILPEPGFGFVTLRPHIRHEGGHQEEVVIPIGAIARIRLAPPEQHPPFGFSKPNGS